MSNINPEKGDANRIFFERSILGKIEDFNVRYPSFAIPIPQDGQHYAEIINNIIVAYESVLAENLTTTPEPYPLPPPASSADTAADT